MTYSNVYLSQRASLPSFGICTEAPYVAALLEKHRQDEDACKRKIAEIQKKYNQIKNYNRLRE